MNTILLVEQSAAAAAAETLVLEHAGFRVLTAGNAEQAATIVSAAQGVEIIFMDIGDGPGADGVQIYNYEKDFPAGDHHYGLIFRK